MTLIELFEKLERIKELKKIPSHRLTHEEMDELSRLEWIQIKEVDYED